MLDSTSVDTATWGARISRHASRRWILLYSVSYRLLALRNMVHPTIETGANIVGVFLSSASILLPHLTWDSTFFRNWSTPSCVSFNPVHALSYWSWNNFAHPSTGPRCKTQSSVSVWMWAIFNSASWSSPRTGMQEASCDASILASMAPESCQGEACEAEPYHL